MPGLRILTPNAERRVIAAIHFAFNLAGIDMPVEFIAIFESVQVTWASMRVLYKLLRYDAMTERWLTRQVIAKRAFGSGPCAVCVYGTGLHASFACRECCMAVLMCTHARVGAESLPRKLPNEILRRILTIEDATQ